MSSEIEIKIGPVELTCRGDVDPDQLDGVLRSLRRSLPELMAARDPRDALSGAPQKNLAKARSPQRRDGNEVGVL